MLRMANEEHGSPFDRGSADSWYGRERKPHFYPHGTYNGNPVTEYEMSPQEIEAYNRGFDENEADPSARKVW